MSFISWLKKTRGGEKSPVFKKEILCPYCHGILEKKPTRKVKCPHCEKPIYVRHGELITEEQKVKHDDMELFRFTEEEYIAEQLELYNKWGFMPSHSDTIWGTANRKIPGLIREKAYYDLRDLYLAMAKYLHREGKDFIEVFRESRKCDLLVYKQNDVEKVEIQICSIASPSCQIYSRKILPTNEAIITMPIPSADCLNKNRKEFHVCGYDTAPYAFDDGQ